MTITEEGSHLLAGPSLWQRAWGRFSVLFASKIAVVGLVIVLFWIIVAIFAPCSDPL